MKRTLQKRELEPVSVGEAEHFHTTLPRSLHSPQVATAAPPPPSAYLVASQLVTCTCGATCPRGKRVGCCVWSSDKESREIPSENKDLAEKYHVFFGFGVLRVAQMTATTFVQHWNIV